jgi:hypothetical protein
MKQTFFCLLLILMITGLFASEITIGAGNQTARIPVDMYWKNSLFECIYLQDELTINSGSITGIALYNNFTSSIGSKPTRIWLGTTALTNLSAGWIPSTQLTQVFNGTVTYPSGANTITISFTTPYNYSGGTLVMMVNRPMDTSYYASSDNFFAQTIGSNRARRAYSDNINYDPANPPASNTLSGQFPKTTFYFAGAGIANDLAALSLSGNSTPTTGVPTPYVITVKNNGHSTQTIYTVNLKQSDGTILTSLNGTPIAEGETIPFTLNWEPTTAGLITVYGEVVLAGDEYPVNNITTSIILDVQTEGTVAVTVGTGGSTGRMPMDMYYMNSLFETVYLSSEINYIGLLTGIDFYNNFTTDIYNKPTNIWVGETSLANLSTGWIPSTQMTQVFSGTVNYPTGANTIHIPLTTPYPYGGGNLVVMAERPMDTAYYASTDLFVTQTVGASRTRIIYSDTIDFDPANPASATPTGMFPKTTFMFFSEGLGALNGTIYASRDVPLAGALVTITGTTLSYTTSATGTYSFPYVSLGTQQLMVTKHGYIDAVQNVIISGGVTTTQDFYLTQLPRVTLSGRIVGNEVPVSGIEGASISFTGYELYNAATGTGGYFSVGDVYAEQAYQYTASASGYLSVSGQIILGSSDFNMGDIVLNENTFPPVNVVAAENVDLSQCTVTWEPPNPNSAPITEGFEAPAFPPTEWTQVISNTGAAGSYGVFPTWCRVGSIALNPPVAPHGGSWQAALWWDYNHQDEWLVTPQFTCPPNANLLFWTYLYLGSTNADHYYVEVTTNNGISWTVLWDASAMTGGWNYYATPISIPLSAYAGSLIYLAWHAIDGPTQDGLWYSWMIDDISVSGAKNLIRFPSELLTSRSAAGSGANRAMDLATCLPPSRALVENPSLREPVLSGNTSSIPERSLQGYKVWRFATGNEANEAVWELLTPDPVTETSFADLSWAYELEGSYKWAVKCAYSGGLMGPAAYSNPLTRAPHTDIAAVMIGGETAPIAGVPATYTVVVQNLGNTILEGSSYSVFLMNGDIVLATLPGVTLAPGQTYPFDLAWTPAASGPVTLTGLVDLPGDPIPANDQTDGYDVNVQNPSTPVVLSSFSAILTGSNNIRLMWVTQSEEGMLGYRVYRNETLDQSASIQITDVIIPATNSSTAHSYELVDDEVSFGSTYYYWLESVDFNQSSFHGPVSVLVQGEVPPVMPELTTMRSAYPNPFQSGTASTIEVALKAGETGTVSIYNVHGQVVRIFSVSEGYHSLIWNGRDASGNNCGSGIYFYKLSTPSLNQTRRLVLTK